MKEIKLRPGIGRNDLNTKKWKVYRLLVKCEVVKVSITFKGRENIHKDIGEKHLYRIIDHTETVSKVMNGPVIKGRVMSVTLTPLLKKGQFREALKNFYENRPDKIASFDRVFSTAWAIPRYISGSITPSPGRQRIMVDWIKRASRGG